MGEEATTKVIPKSSLEKEVAAMVPIVNKRRRKRRNGGAGANAPPKVLRKDYAASRPPFLKIACKNTTATDHVLAAVTRRSKWLCRDPWVQVAVTATYRPKERATTLHLRGSNTLGGDLDGRFPRRSLLQGTCDLPATEESHSQDSRTGSKDQGEGGRDKKLDQEIKSFRIVETEVHGLHNQAKNLETLLEAEVDMKNVAEAKNIGLAKELEREARSSKEGIKATFEEFKKYEDDRVNSWCVEIDARLDALSIDFDEELYPHMLTAIAGHRWVIGHGLRLAIMKCVEFTKLRQVFADVVSAGVAKGISEGLKHGIEHGKANLDLSAIEAYNPEAKAKYVVAFYALKDLKYPLVNQLKKLKNVPIDLIMHPYTWRVILEKTLLSGSVSFAPALLN
nr:hypothetical protein [Tanacetum cinerariifolium]